MNRRQVLSASDVSVRAAQPWNRHIPDVLILKPAIVQGDVPLIVWKLTRKGARSDHPSVTVFNAKA